jgi:triacylglycerol esterase/lipase EstA (alpha/beta hydrolase family)
MSRRVLKRSGNLPLLSLLAFGCGAEPGLGGSTGETVGSETVGGETGETGNGESTSDSTNPTTTATTTTTDPTEETGEPSCDPSMPDLLEQDYLAAGDARAAVHLSACDNHVWWVSAAAGSELTVSFDASAAIDVAISYPDDPSFTDTLTAATLYTPGQLELVSPRSGEFAVVVRAQNPGDDPLLELDYDITVACSNQCQLETTRWPIVFVHGWTGFENIGPLTYFYNVREDLDLLGYPIATAVLDPYNSVDIRGEQLAAFVDTTLTTQRARKVNLFGHSQGGIDSRYVASPAGGARPVGAVITLGTPHQGTPFTDIALGLIPGPTETVLAFLLNFLGATQDQQSDVLASLDTLSETYMQGEFNQIMVDAPDVKYWSWMGETCVGGIGCDDAVDPLLLFSYQTIFAIAGGNDGLVPIESAKWGEYLGLIPADHIDEIGQIAGLTGLNFDHIEFFRDNARMLREERY